MNNKDNEILFKIKHRHISNTNENNDSEIQNKKNNMSYNSISNYLLKNNKNDIAKMLEKDNEIKKIIPKNISPRLLKEINESTLEGKGIKNNQKNAYSNLSNELFHFNRKINKVLLDLHNIQEDLNKKRVNESCSFEIRQNSVGDDEFYINNRLVNEDYFMKQLMQYKKK